MLNLFNNSLNGPLGNPLPPALTFFSVSLNKFSGGIPDNWGLPRTLQELW